MIENKSNSQNLRQNRKNKHLNLNNQRKRSRLLNVENDKSNKSLKMEKDKTKKLKKSLNYCKDKASRYIKDLIIDEEEEIELLQEQLKELK